MLSLQGHCPQCYPYLGATPVAEPVRALEPSAGTWGSARLTSYELVALQGSPATSLVRAAAQSWVEEELL